MSAADVRRPTLVTVVSVLTVISGVLDVLLGLVWLFTVDADRTSTVAPVIGIAYIVLGIVQVAVARGLLRGDPRSRTVMTFAIILSFVTSSFALRAGGNPRALSTFDVVVAVIVLVVLYTPRANAFFTRGAVTARART